MNSSKIDQKIITLKSQYEHLKIGKESLLALIDETEVTESVYNSNAIENSTLTLKETEKILLDLEVSKDLSLREVYEAKNLGRVSNYIQTKSQQSVLDSKLILLLHQMLLGGINDGIAGRFREKGEYVRVGTHIAPAPEIIDRTLQTILINFNSQLDHFFIERISKYHLEFESLHPFIDGNGRIGRVLINFQLLQLGFPPLIIRNKNKKDYYAAFKIYQKESNIAPMAQLITLALKESLHKRIAYLKGLTIIKLTHYAQSKALNISSTLNAAKRQTIPAFREKEIWKIGLEK